MSDSVKHKSKSMEHSSTRHGKKKKSKKRSSLPSSDCASTSDQRHSCGKEKRRKSKRKKHRKSSRIDASLSDSSTIEAKDGTRPRTSTRKDLEFCENAKRAFDVRDHETIQSVGCFGSRSKEQSDKVFSMAPAMKIKNQSVDGLTEVKTEKKDPRDGLYGSSGVGKANKSRKQRSRSSSTSNSGHSPSDNEGSSPASSSSSDSAKQQRKQRKKKKLAKKLMKREEKKRKKERRKMKKLLKERAKVSTLDIEREINDASKQDRLLKDINVELADRARAMAPMTREQWEKKQSIIRRVYDEETGRQRLIKGDGEVLEEIVSRDRHMAINKQATKGDGEFFQSRLNVRRKT